MKLRARSVLAIFALFASSFTVIGNSATANDATVSTSTGGTATYLASTGHYYEYVGQAVDFAAAKTAAEAARANGWAGYLVTITSDAEVSIAASVSGNRSHWIGASDGVSEGCWKWINGTAADLSGAFFAAANASGCSTSQSFTKWGTNEPNDFNALEDFALAMGQTGAWNDHSGAIADANGPVGYLIEYGERSDFPNPTPTPTPINLSSQIQAQSISATITSNFATLTVNVPDAKGWTWTVIWDGAAQRGGITTFPYQTASGWSANKSIQLYAVDSLNNYGYSTIFTPTVVTPAPTSQATLAIEASQSVNVGQSSALTTTGGSGTGAVTYSVSNSQICSVSGTTLLGVDAGDCVITATKAADNTYSAITATKTIQIIAAPDTAAPVISNVTITPTAALENSNVTISAAITDQTGVSSVTATLIRNASRSVTISEVGLSTGVITLTRTSGTDKNGTWSFTSGLNFSGGQSNGFLLSGYYDLVITASDTGNRTSSTSPQVAALTVGRQVPNPVVLSPVISTTSAIIGSQIQVSARAVVYGNTISKVSVSLGGNALGNLALSSGTTSDGVWSGTLTVPTSLSPSTYTVNIVAESGGRISATLAAGTLQVTAPAPTVYFALPLISATVGGQVTVLAQGGVAATSPGRVAFVCLSTNRTPISGFASPSGSGTWYASNSASFGPTSNCYQTSSSINKSGEFKWIVDGSSWADGGRELSLYIIDSTGSISPTVTRTILVQNGTPTISFTTPTANSTQSGRFEIRARGAVASGSTAAIRFICFKLDGSPYMDGRVNSPTNGAWWSSNYPASVGGSNNCWNVSVGGTGEFAVVIDATTLSNGSHSFEAFIQDNSGKVSTWASLPFNVNIAQPTIAFTTPTASSTQSGRFEVRARGAVAPGSTAAIRFICFKLDGSPYMDGRVNSPTNGAWWSSNYPASVGGSNNCWNVSVGGTGEFAVVIDATTLSNGSHSFEAFIQDNSGKVSTWASLPFNVNIAQPTIAFTTPTASSTQSGRFEVRARGAVAPGSTAAIRFICFKLDGSPYMDGRVNSPTNGAWWSSNYPASVGGSNNCWNVSVGGTGEFAVVIDATTLSNGSHSFEAFIQDNSGKVSTWASLPFNVNIAQPTIAFTTPTASSTQSGRFEVRARGAVAPGSTAAIRFICFKLDGSPYMDGRVNSPTNGAWWSSNYPASVGGSNNCWNVSVGGTGEFAVVIDATTLSNGSHSFEAFIQDNSGKVSTWASLPFNVNIAQPTIAFTTPTANSTQSGRFEIRARGAVASGSTAAIRFICFKLDGSPYMDGRVNSPTNGAWWSSNYPASVGGSNNCWNVSVGGTGEFAVVIDAANLNIGAHNFEAFIQDNSGKVSTWASLPFDVKRAVPSIEITSPASRATITSGFEITATADVFPGSTARIAAVCLQINGSLTTSYKTGSWASGTTNVSGVGSCFATNGAGQKLNVSFKPDLKMLSNGSHSLALLPVDTFGKLGEWKSVQFSVSLPSPTISTTNSSVSVVQQGVVNLAGSAKVAAGSDATLEALVVSVDGWGELRSSLSDSAQEQRFSYDLNTRTLKSGSRTVQYYVVDSFGRQSNRVATTITVENALPSISIINPTSGAESFGKLSVEIAMSSSSGLWGVGINLANAKSLDGRGGDGSSGRSGLPTNTEVWSLGGESRFVWEVDISKLAPGPQRLITSVIDVAGQVSTAETSFVVQTPNPVVTVISPAQNQVVKGKVEIRALVSTPIGSGKTLRFVGIAADNGVDYQPAKAQFTAGRGYTYNIPSKYVSSGISGSQTSFNASWTVDFSKSKPGNYLIEVAAEDSSGIITEKVIRFTVAKPLPVVKILSPVSDQTINGAILLKVNAVSDPATTSKISYIAVSSTLFTPQFLGRSTYSCQLDSKYVCLSVEDLKEYSWTSPIVGWKDGDYTLTVIAIDESGNTGTQSVNFKVSSVAPSVSITSPSAGVISKSSFTVSASAIANTSSGAEIIAVAISDRSATPQFPGSLYGRQVVGLPSDAAIWQVANIKNPSWLLDPSNWSEGDRVINVFAIDSNGKLGQSSITVHVAPEPTWRIDVQGSPVLDKSVPILVTMTTNIPRRSNPPVVIVLQTSNTSAGPWTDLGQITLDSSGTGSGNVLVKKDFYVRVNHPNLDAVQPGTSAAKRIVSVPDPSRPGGNIGTGVPNDDGSIPRVICTVPPKAKSGAKLVFSCVAENVQDSSQGVTILQQTGSGNKKIGNAKIRGSKITGTISVKAKGNITFRLSGADGKYVPWTSNPFTVKYN